MSALSAIKAATSFVASAGAASVVANTVKHSIPANAKLIKKISMGVGGFVLGQIASDYASRYVEDFISQTEDQFRNAQNVYRQQREENAKNEPKVD